MKPFGDILRKKKLKLQYKKNPDAMRNESPIAYHYGRHHSEFNVKVRLLDDVEEPLDIKLSVEDIGKVLFGTTCERIGNLVECDYFGLRFVDKHNERQWLDMEKPVFKQLKGCTTYLFSFRVKHYPLHPLEDIKQDLTRYLLYLQIRRDLARGRLLCPSGLISWIGSNILQAELGDAPFIKCVSATPSSDSTLQLENTDNRQSNTSNTTEEADDDLSANITQDYMKRIRIFKDQTDEMDLSILHNYETLHGVTQQEAESEVLRCVSQLTTYGIDRFAVHPLHKVVIPTPSSKNALSVISDADLSTTNTTKEKLHEHPSVLPSDTPFYLGITGRGITTFVGLQQCEVFTWNQIERFSCDGKQFSIRLNKQMTKSPSPSYQCPSKATALAIWRWAIDRKCFFTLQDASQAKKMRTAHRFLHRSHSYKFSGRSQQELNKLSISNGTNDIVRFASLRGERTNKLGLTNKPTTLPARPRPSLNLDAVKEVVSKQEETTSEEETAKASETAKNEMNEQMNTSVETAKETVTEVEMLNSLQTTANSDSDAYRGNKIVEEEEIEAGTISAESAAPECSAAVNIHHSKTAGDQECKEISHSDSLEFQNVVSVLDRTLESFKEPVYPTSVRSQLPAVNGDIHKNEKLANNELPNSDEKDNNSTTGKLAAGRLPEKASSICDLGATTVTVSLVTVLLITGVFVAVENSQLKAMVDPSTLRYSHLFSSFESYIYNPVRDTVVKLVSSVWPM